MSDLPYRYRLDIEVEILGDGIHANDDGAKATATRLSELLEADAHVAYVTRWPEITYLGREDEDD